MTDSAAFELQGRESRFYKTGVDNSGCGQINNLHNDTHAAKERWLQNIH